MIATTVSTTFLQDLYARMLLTRLVDDCARYLYSEGLTSFIASSRGHEAAQVGSAVCIEVGKDFTLPYYRDVGVVLTIGMTPYEILRTYLHLQSPPQTDEKIRMDHPRQTYLHWGYHKHNMVTGPAPVATQVLHAAGIAFASTLRKANVVTVAYCGDGATGESDFLEGIRFAATHKLPVVIICEQDCTPLPFAASDSRIEHLELPPGLLHRRVDGQDVQAVYHSTSAAMQHAREGQGPVLLELRIHRPLPHTERSSNGSEQDPLLHCQHLLQAQGEWSEKWASELYQRLMSEVEQAKQDALRDSAP